MKDKFIILDLQPYFNADAISSNDNRIDGMFGLLTSFPAEELPESKAIVTVNEVPFMIPPKEDGINNNIECYSELIEVPEGKYCRLHILGGCDNGSFEEKFTLIYSETEEQYKIGLSNTTLMRSMFKEQSAFKFTHLHAKDGEHIVKSTIWHQSQNIESWRYLQKIKLPDNPCYHIFAITLERNDR
ncbi:MAG: hypothetical protein KAX49_02960 [Halanaerobiales bacterium]|nr:hypothetical protein [Halanaerobiales bacterium]